MDLKDLQKQIPYQWRVQSFSKNKPQASCIAYIDARDAMNRLDEVVGAANWQDEYKVINGQMFAGVGIKCGEEWVWKWDTGTESQTEKEKGIVSDAFKRACVKWGIGRFLYDLDVRYVDADTVKEDKDTIKKEGMKYSKYPNVVDKNGKKVWDLTKHINDMTPDYKQQTTPTAKPPMNRPDTMTLADAELLFSEK